MTVAIEIGVPDTATTKQKGDLLETLARSVLERMHYEVTDQLRFTGMEIDVLGTHRQTGETIYVECKAHTQPISADSITKLLGNVHIRDVAAGWLLTTSPLTKDGIALKHEWKQKPTEQRRKLHLYDPDDLVDVLVSSGEIVDSSRCPRSSTYTYADQPHLLISSIGKYWCWPILDTSTGLRASVSTYTADTGQPVADTSILQTLASFDTTLRELEWISSPPASPNDGHPRSLEQELESVVAVPSADSWADYRPARPRDFVGRDTLHNEIFSLLDEVRTTQTRTRILALKSPSGWGKSSSVIKLIDKSRNRRNRNKFYIAGVDCRAAVSARYAELALLQCLRNAAADQFIPRPLGDFRIQSITQPFLDESLASTAHFLRSTGRVLVLVFDQFEEIFSKQELGPLFRELGNLCNAIDAAQENIVLAFSWKTDGTIPQDHPAYHMWQALSDRRREFQLSPFTSKEISRSLSLFEKQLGYSLNPQVRRLLSDQCQGYPWLLKKLCIHVYESMQRGVEQIDIANRALNVQELFETELETLSGTELACVKRIARDSPAEFHEVEDSFGGDVIRSLIDKRIILRTGSRLMLYWDIFKDYVLSGRVPNIPVSYIPQSDPTRYTTAVRELVAKRQLRYRDLSNALNVTHATADNVVRDLVMVGNASAERKIERINALQDSPSDAARAIQRFCRHHVLMRRLLQVKGPGFVVGIPVIRETLKDVYKGARYADTTWGVYANRLVAWLRAFRIVEIRGDKIHHLSDTTVDELPTHVPRASRGHNKASFLGDAPPERVVEALDLLLCNGAMSVNSHPTLRNSYYVLVALGLAYRNRGTVVPFETSASANTESIVINAVRDAPNFRHVAELLHDNSTLTGFDIGESLARSTETTWSDSSKKRYGSALRRWVRWVDERTG